MKLALGVQSVSDSTLYSMYMAVVLADYDCRVCIQVHSGHHVWVCTVDCMVVDYSFVHVHCMLYMCAKTIAYLQSMCGQ